VTFRFVLRAVPGANRIPHYDTTDDTLYYSSDGTTASALVVAQLQSGVLLNAHDMMIV
jgi:hypothetical protein